MTLQIEWLHGGANWQEAPRRELRSTRETCGCARSENFGCARRPARARPVRPRAPMGCGPSIYVELRAIAPEIHDVVVHRAQSPSERAAAGPLGSESCDVSRRRGRRCVGTRSRQPCRAIPENIQCSGGSRTRCSCRPRSGPKPIGVLGRGPISAVSSCGVRSDATIPCKGRQPRGLHRRPSAPFLEGCHFLGALTRTHVARRSGTSAAVARACNSPRGAAPKRCSTALQVHARSGV